MTEQDKCDNCGSPLPDSLRGGLCPACLLKRGLETNTIGFTDEDQAEAARRWTPPTVEQLASIFPELDILELIGRGGMGAVYKAREKQLDRLVALKILPPEIGREPAFAQSFAREAQAMAKLGHSNIVTIYSFGSRPFAVSHRLQTGAGDGEKPAPPESAPVSLYYFIMEYVDGLSLRQLLDAAGVGADDKRAAMNPKEALAIVPQICDALQYAHDRGIVHRDIKPENILLNRAGQVKIADFGLAKLVGLTPAGAADQTADAGSPGAPGSSRRSSAQPDVTQAGEKVMGTPQYMAPEQIERPREVDHRADIYSLGVVFYQMLTGELPKGKFEPPSRKVVIDVRLDEVVLRALEREPARRYQQVSEVRTQVETIVSTSEPAATTESTVPATNPLSRRRILYVSLFLFASICAFASGIINLSRYGNRGSHDYAIMGVLWLIGAAGFAIAALRHYRGVTVRRTAKRPMEEPADHRMPLNTATQPPVLSPEAAAQIERARQAVKAPAIGMIVAAGIQALVALPILAMLVVRTFVVTAQPSDTATVTMLEPLVLFWWPALLVLTIVPTVVILWGAIRMMQVRTRALAITAAILALIAAPGNIIGLPMGIWALVVLSRRAVIEAFKLSEKDKTMGKSRISLWLLLAVIAVLTPVALWAASKADEGQKTQSASQPALYQHMVLGPVIERVVNHTGENCLIDLDTGTLITPPREPFEGGSKTAIEWARKHGIDAGGGTQPEIQGLIGFDIIALPVDNKVWNLSGDAGLMADKQNAFAVSTPGNPVYLSAKGGVPATYKFQTREGGLGVLQIVGFTDEPKGTKIRYKMLQATAAVAHVLKTTPAAFANNVDPATDKITVTFDRPMMDKSWSFTAGDKAFSEKTGSQFPERPSTGSGQAGEISYDAARTTCTMPVKLQPGKVYWVGVNSPQHQQFKSAEGTPARPYQILFATRSADGKPTPLLEELVKQAREINVAAEGVSSDEALQGKLKTWVEKFFSENYRDITARKTLEWGQPETTPGGNLSIRYKYLATIWNKDQMIIEQRFTFTPEGKYISAETIEKGPTSQQATQPSADTTGASAVDLDPIRQKLDLSSPEATVKAFTVAAAKGNIDEAMACLRIDSYDYDDIAKLLAKESKHPMAALIAAIDLNTEIQIEKKVFEGEQQDRCMIAWKVTLAKPWSLEEHGQRISLKAGETHTLDGTVVRTGDIWLIAGI